MLPLTQSPDNNQRFLTDATFQMEIENIVSSKRLSYIDAILHYCNENDLDPIDIKKLINVNLKDKIKLDAMDAGLMRRESALPI
jgi:hypothetical protein